MDDGFILIHRKILKEWEWYSNTNDTRLWLHCLLKANWEDRWFEGIKIERGSFVTSYNKLSKELGLTTQQVRTSINHLKLTQNITSKQHSKFSIISINNYDKYQLANTLSNKQATSKQQASNNKRKKEMKDNEVNEDLNKEYLEEYIVVDDNNVVKEIIDYLNLRTGQHYKYTTQKTKTLIKARLKEKFTIEDFKEVIDKMCVEWMNTDMQKYLRPETLFGNKFESYLNREVRQTTKNMKLTTEDIQSLLG